MLFFLLLNFKKEVLIMPSTQQVYEKIKKIRCKESDIGVPEVIKLFDLFPEAVVDGKLILDNIDFSRLGPTLSDIDFSNCILSRCKFTYLNIIDCIFNTDVLSHNDFSDAYIPQKSNKGLEQPTTSDEKNLRIWHLSEREAAWWKLISKEYPQDIFKYSNLKEHAEYRFSPISHIDGFYTFRREKYLDQEGLGWKLHISVRQSDLEKSFELAAPIIASYCNAFKVSIPDEIPTARLKVNAQMTVYLEDHDKLQLRPQQAQELIERVTAVFKENNISPALSIPLSDAPTQSSYFSIRNDKDINMRQNYVSAQDAGSNFNPANHPNPYKNILKKQPAPFNLLNHFNTLHRKNRAQGLNALRLTMLGYLNEHCKEDILTKEIDEKTIERLHSQMFGDDEIGKEFIHPQYHEDASVFQRIKVCFLIENYLSLLQLSSWPLNSNYDNNSVFSSLYVKDDEFYRSLKVIEESIYKLPLTDTVEWLEPITIQEYMDKFSKSLKITEESIYQLPLTDTDELDRVNDAKDNSGTKSSKTDSLTSLLRTFKNPAFTADRGLDSDIDLDSDDDKDSLTHNPEAIPHPLIPPSSDTTIKSSKTDSIDSITTSFNFWPYNQPVALLNDDEDDDDYGFLMDKPG